MRFDSVVELGGKTATGFEVPADIVAELGHGKRPPVRVTINGYTYRSTVASMGGRFLLPLSAPNREAAGVAAGDPIQVEVELDTAPREVVLPVDLAAALAADPAAQRGFDRLSYSGKQGYVQPIEAAKTEVTRRRRIDKTIATLRTAAD